MERKEKIRKAPFKVHRLARAYYYGSEISKELYIKIEIIDEQKGIGLFSQGIYHGHAREKYYEYDKDGRKFFNNLMPKFGKIIVQFQDGTTKEFDNYEKFLDEITSD